MSSVPPPAAAHTSRPPSRRRRRTLQMLAFAGLLVVAGALVWLALRGGSQSGSSGPLPIIGRGTDVAGRSTGPGRHAGAAQAPAGAPIDVAVDLTPSAVAVPRDFLGLSFEVGELARIAGFSDHGNLAALLRSLGHGVMRFGGVSADEQTAWVSRRFPRPAWAGNVITSADLAGLARLARATGWRVLLTLNLGHPDAPRIADEAATARARLGSVLAGFAIGNEPDQYQRRRLRTGSWSFKAYQQQILSLRRAVSAAAPGVPLVGPDASSGAPPLPWVRQAAAAIHPAMLTDHFYPSSSCGYTPVISDLFDPRTRTAESGMLGALAALSRQSQIPLRLDETNNISCRGQRGVSNSFAAALWAVDYTSRAIAAGLPGVNFHDLVGETLTYSPVAASNRAQLASGVLQAKPEFYALLLARRLLGDRPVTARVATAPGSSYVTAAALLTPQGHLHLVLVNFNPIGSEPVLVRLAAPPQFGPGPILRLTAPAPASTTGVELGGSRVARDGTWSSQTPLETVYGAPGALSLSLPPASAALVTLLPAR